MILFIVDTIIIRTMDNTNKMTTAMIDSEMIQRWIYGSYKIMDIQVYVRSDIKPYTHWRVEIEVALPRYAEIYRCGSLMSYRLDIDPCGYISEIHTTHPYTDEFIYDTLLPRIKEKIQTIQPDVTSKQWTF